MKLTDLSPEIKQQIKKIRYDRIVEKHEGGYSYDTQFEYVSKLNYVFRDEASRIAHEKQEAEDKEKYKDAEFLQIEGKWVLLPLGAEHHPNLTFLRVLHDVTDETMTLFLRDTTFDDYYLDTGFIAIAEKFPDQDFYITTVYHELFIMPTVAQQIAQMDT